MLSKAARSDALIAIAGVAVGAVAALTLWRRGATELPVPHVGPRAPAPVPVAAPPPDLQTPQIIMPVPAPPIPRSARTSAVLERLWTPKKLAAPAHKKPWPKRGVVARPPARRVPVTAAPIIPDELRGSIRRVALPSNQKVIALTFDLCELTDNVMGYDAGVVNALRSEHAPATFFAGGKWMRSHEEKAMQLMADPSFEIGTHTWTHGNLHELGGAEMKNEIVWGVTEYELLWEKLAARARKAGVRKADIDTIPRRPALFRFPYGTCNADSLAAVADAGLEAIQWDVVSGDAEKNATPRLITLRVLSQVRPGSIIVFHGNKAGHGTAKALPALIEELRAEGYTLVTVSELLAMGSPEIKQECYAVTPGDSLMYDSLVGEGFRRWRK